MKKQIRVFDVVCAIAMGILCWYIIYFPPILGIADQGDFHRVMVPAGLSFLNGIENHILVTFVQDTYKMNFIEVWDKWLYLPRLMLIIPCTTAIYPIAIAKVICRIFCGDVFYTPVLALVMCLLFSGICVILLRRFSFDSSWGKYLFAAAFLWIFFDGSNITAFNSMYGQGMILVGLGLFVLACILLIQNQERQKKRYLLLYCAGCITILGAKLQCVTCLPFMLVVYLYLWRKWDFRKLTLALAVLTIWFGAGHYFINGHGVNGVVYGFNPDTQYNSVFCGILKYSEDPAADLVSLGLDPAMAADAGKQIYLDPEEYAYCAPRTEEMEKMFFSKMSNGVLLRFYLTHPARLLQGMEITAQNAFDTRYTWMGTYAPDAGVEAGSHTLRFDSWSELRLKLPRTLWFILPAYLMFLGVGAYWGIKKKNPYAQLFLLIMLMGGVQFPMPYLGNGDADITKQLYLFNLCFDIGILTVAVGGCRWVFKQFTEEFTEE